MKKITLLLSTLVLAAATSIAQRTETRITYKFGGEYNQKFELAYDSNDYQTLYALYTWDSDLGKWKGKSKYEYARDSKGNDTLEIISTWDSDLEEWQEYLKYKYEYAHDSKGNDTLVIVSIWDSDLEEWQEYDKYKYEYTYDSEGNITLRIAYAWQEGIGWDKTSEYTYEYPPIAALSSLFADQDANITGYYTIYGARLPKEPERGLYIIMYDNGKAEKILK